MTNNIELTDKCVSSLNTWLASLGKPDLTPQRVAFDLLDIPVGRVGRNETTSVELGRMCTRSGNPEHYTFGAAEWTAETLAGDE